MKRRGFLQFLGIGAAAPVIAAAAPKVEEAIAAATEPWVPPVVEAAPIVDYRDVCTTTCFSYVNWPEGYAETTERIGNYTHVRRRRI